MLERMAEASPRLMARVAGVFYLLNFMTGAFAAFAGRRDGALGDVANLLATAFYIVVTVLFYSLYKPVDKNLSLIAALFSLAGCTLGVLRIFHLAPVPISPLVCFGFYCLLIGYLTFRSTFLPRVLGVLMALGGLGWLTFLIPSLARSLSPYNLAPGMLGEGLLTLWLLAKGVNVERWRAQARAEVSRQS
jgi:hypothetical protein